LIHHCEIVGKNIDLRITYSYIILVAGQSKNGNKWRSFQSKMGAAIVSLRCNFCVLDDSHHVLQYKGPRKKI